MLLEIRIPVLGSVPVFRVAVGELICPQLRKPQLPDELGVILPALRKRRRRSRTPEHQSGRWEALDMTGAKQGNPVPQHGHSRRGNLRADFLLWSPVRHDEVTTGPLEPGRADDGLLPNPAIRVPRPRHLLKRPDPPLWHVVPRGYLRNTRCFPSVVITETNNARGLRS